MDLLSAIATCSLHDDITLVIAMVMAFSQGSPYAIQNAAQPEPAVQYTSEEDPLRLPVAEPVKAPRSRAEAEAKLRGMTADGGLPVLGLLPVPAAWAAMFGRKPTELFNPCINLSIATARLSEFEYNCGKAGRTCVLREYAKAAELEYLEQDVLDELGATDAGAHGRAGVIDETDAMLRAPVSGGAGEDRTRDWGADRLFFALPAGETSGTKSAGDAKSEAEEPRKADAKRDTAKRP